MPLHAIYSPAHTHKLTTLDNILSNHLARLFLERSSGFFILFHILFVVLGPILPQNYVFFYFHNTSSKITELIQDPIVQIKYASVQISNQYPPVAPKSGPPTKRQQDRLLKRAK